MQDLPNLSELSNGQKDQLIRNLWPLQQQVKQLAAHIAALQERTQHLSGRLSLNSKNSSKPPPSVGLNKPAPKSLRVAGQRPTGGQKGHPGTTLRQASKPSAVAGKSIQESSPPLS